MTLYWLTIAACAAAIAYMYAAAWRRDRASSATKETP